MLMRKLIKQNILPTANYNTLLIILFSLLYLYSAAGEEYHVFIKFLTRGIL